MPRCAVNCAILSLSVMCFWLAAEPSKAQTSDLPMAVMDVQQILRDSAAVRDLNERVADLRNASQEQARQREGALRQSDQDFAARLEGMDEAAAEAERQALQDQWLQLQRDVQDQRRAIDEAFAQAMSNVQSGMVSIAQEIAQERSLEVVLLKSTVVLVRPELDITFEVLRRLNERLPRVAFDVSLN